MADDKNKQQPPKAPPAPAAVEDRLGKLETVLDQLGQENKRLAKENAEMKAAIATGNVSLLKTYTDHVAEQERSAAKAKRHALREKTHKPGDGMHEYIVGEYPSYYGGQMYQPGERVRIKEDELPSITWKPAPAPKADADEIAPPPSKQGPRAADTEV